MAVSWQPVAAEDETAIAGLLPVEVMRQARVLTAVGVRCRRLLAFLY